MSLPLGPAVTTSSLRRIGAVLLILVLWGAALPGRAAGPDPFSASVTVDATADSIVKARDRARVDGQRRALATVVANLAGSAARLPRLDDKAITDLVTSFSVDKERMSAVRYVADYTFHFRPEGVRRLLGDAGIALLPQPVINEAGTGKASADASGKQAAAARPSGMVVLIPLLQAQGQARLWEDPNPWRQAWEGRSTAPGSPRLILPLGDAGDLAALDADQARTGDAKALAAIAGRNGASGAVVALAAVQGPAAKPTGLEITLRRYSDGRLVDTVSSPFPAKPGESEDALLQRAVAASLGELASSEAGWKREPAAADGSPADLQNANLPTATIAAVLPISGLDDWVQARQRIAALPMVRKLALMALSREEATIEIGYTGSIDDLRSSLAGISLGLVRGERLWHLARTAAPHP